MNYPASWLEHQTLAADILELMVGRLVVSTFSKWIFMLFPCFFCILPVPSIVPGILFVVPQFPSPCFSTLLCALGFWPLWISSVKDEVLPVGSKWLYFCIKGNWVTLLYNHWSSWVLDNGSLPLLSQPCWWYLPPALANPGASPYHGY